MEKKPWTTIAFVRDALAAACNMLYCDKSNGVLSYSSSAPSFSFTVISYNCKKQLLECSNLLGHVQLLVRV
jgi:hypothetical protein